jgi:hypothetical protein
MKGAQHRTLTTAAGIFAAFKAIADAETSNKYETIDLMKDLATLLLARPLKEIAGCVATDSDVVHKVLSIMHNRLYGSGSKDMKAVTTTGVSLVDEFMRVGNFNAANNWLARDYNRYPQDSEERKAVAAKRLSLADWFLKAGDFEAADEWLVTSFNLYPKNSDEERAVVAKQKQVRQQRSSGQMGVSPEVDIAGLRAIAKQELAKGETHKLRR